MGVHQTNILHLLHEKLKMFPYRLAIGEEVSETDNEGFVALAELYKEKLEWKPYFLRYIFSLAKAVASGMVL